MLSTPELESLKLAQICITSYLGGILSVTWSKAGEKILLLLPPRSGVIYETICLSIYGFVVRDGWQSDFVLPHRAPNYQSWVHTTTVSQTEIVNINISFNCF